MNPFPVEDPPADVKMVPVMVPDISNKQVNGKIDIRKAAALRLKGLSYSEIAKQFNCTTSAVYQKLSDYLPGLKGVDLYKDHRADILACKQSELLESLTPDKITDMTALQAITGFGVLFDKERLTRGESTENIAYHDIGSSIEEIEAELRELETK